MNYVMGFKMEYKDNVYSLYLYDEIKPSRYNWDGEFIESTTDANYIREQLDAIPDGADIDIYISSNGGDVKTGLAIYSMLCRKKAKKTAYIDGFACSIASVIPMACQRVVMYPTSLIMIHNASGGFFGNAEQHRQFANDLDVISSSAVTAYLEKAGDKLDRDTLNKMLNAETWLNAKDCVKYGLCDAIEIPRDNDTITSMCKTTTFGMYRKLSETMYNSMCNEQVMQEDKGITNGITLEMKAEEVKDTGNNVEPVINREEEKSNDTLEMKIDVDSVEDKNSKKSDVNSMIDILFNKLF